MERSSFENWVIISKGIEEKKSLWEEWIKKVSGKT